MSDPLTHDSSEMIAPVQRPRRIRWGTAFRGAVTFSILAYLAYKIDWPLLVAQMARADYAWLSLAGLLFGTTYLFAAVRWWFLMRVQEIHLPLRIAAALTLVGQFFNSFMLGSIGGDIVKAVYLHKYAPRQKTHAALSIIMDRVLGLFVLLSASLLSLPWLLRSSVHSDQADDAIFGLLVVFGTIAAGAFAMATAPFHRAPNILHAIWRRVPHRHVLELVVSGFRQHGAALHLTLAAVAAGAVLTFILVLAGYCIAKGIRLDVTYLQLLVIMTVAICVISLPISLGGHGVREGIFVLMFAAFGIISVDRHSGSGQEPAILFSLLYFAMQMVWSLVGAIVYLTFRHEYGSNFSGPRA
jgi:uncharacterized protein (TIRG00374 family)